MDCDDKSITATSTQPLDGNSITKKRVRDTWYRYLSIEHVAAVERRMPTKAFMLQIRS